jgi:hypothetical protein
LRTKQSFRHGGDLVWNSKHHSRKDNTSIVSGSKLLHRQGDIPHELGVHLWDARLRQSSIAVAITKGDIQDNCRTKICTMYTINNILEGTVGINCMVDTITTAIILAKD